MKEQLLIYLILDVINKANFVYQYAVANNLQDSQDYINYQDELNRLSVIYNEDQKN